MKKSIAVFGFLLIITACGESVVQAPQPSPSSESSASPIATVTPSPKESKSLMKDVAIEGSVVSCKDTKFVAQPEKDLILNCLDGTQGFNVGAIKGPAIVNVWGSWCPPCVAEIPLFVNFYKNLDPSIQLVGIDFQDGPRFAVEPFIKSSGITWPNFVDPDGLASTISGSNVPVTWFINSKEEMSYIKFGPVSSVKELQQLTSKYLGES